MDKQTLRFATVTRNHEVVRVGHSFITQPPVHYTGAGTKWFDDEKLIKKHKKH